MDHCKSPMDATKYSPRPFFMAQKKAPAHAMWTGAGLQSGGDLLSRFRSTIGAHGLNFSVRDGKRWGPVAMATLILGHRCPISFLHFSFVLFFCAFLVHCFRSLCFPCALFCAFLALSVRSCCTDKPGRNVLNRDKNTRQKNSARRESLWAISTARLCHHWLCTCGLSTSWSATALVWRPHLEGGFALRCFQRLSRPYLATRRCPWRDNRHTRGMSNAVLSY